MCMCRECRTTYTCAFIVDALFRLVAQQIGRTAAALSESNARRRTFLIASFVETQKNKQDYCINNNIPSVRQASGTVDVDEASVDGIGVQLTDTVEVCCHSSCPVAGNRVCCRSNSAIARTRAILYAYVVSVCMYVAC